MPMISSLKLIKIFVIVSLKLFPPPLINQDEASPPNDLHHLPEADHGEQEFAVPQKPVRHRNLEVSRLQDGLRL